MTDEERLSVLMGGDLAPPYTVHTSDGRSYEVSDPACLWSPPGFPGVIAIAIPRKAIVVVRIDAIDSITCEGREGAGRAGR